MAKVKLEWDTSKVDAGLRKWEQSTERAGKAGKQSANTIEREFDKMEKTVKPRVLSVTKVLTGLGLSFSALGAAHVIGKITTLSATFQTGIQNVGNLASMTKKQIKELGDGIKVVATETGQPLEKLQKALFDTVSAGIPAGEAIEFVGIAGKLAVAGVTDIAVATDGLTSVINAYGLAASDASLVADRLFAAQKLGKTTVEELSSNIGKLAPLTHAAGVSMEEMFAALSLVTSVGISTDEATTSLVAVFNSLIQVTPEAAKAAKAMGIEWNLNALHAKGVTGVLKEMIKATDGNIEKIGELIPNIRGMKGILALLTDEGKKYDGFVRKVTDDTGVMNAAYEKMNETFQKNWDVLKNKFNIVLLDLGEKILPFATQKAKEFSAVFDKLHKALKGEEEEFLFNKIPSSADDAKQHLEKLSAEIENTKQKIEDINKIPIAKSYEELRHGALYAKDINAMLMDQEIELENLEDEYKKVSQSLVDLTQKEKEASNINNQLTKKKKDNLIALDDEQKKLFEKTLTDNRNLQDQLVAMSLEGVERRMAIIGLEEASRAEAIDKQLAQLTEDGKKDTDLYRQLQEEKILLVEVATQKISEIQSNHADAQREKQQQIFETLRDMQSNFDLELLEMNENKFTADMERLDIEFEKKLQKIVDLREARLEDGTLTREMEEGFLVAAENAQIMHDEKLRQLKEKTFKEDLNRLTHYKNFSNNVSGNIVKAFVQGESVKEAVFKSTQNTLMQISSESMNKVMSTVIEKSIGSIAGALGWEMAETGGWGAAKGGVWGSIKEVALALGKAGVTMAAAKALAGSAFKAEGGYINKNYAGGGFSDIGRTGIISKGTHSVADDVLVRSSPAMNVWASKGEYIVNAKQTNKYLGLLEKINSGAIDRGFENGGAVMEGIKAAKISAALGKGAYFSYMNAYYKAGDSWWGVGPGLAAASIFLASTLGSMAAAKGIGKQVFKAEGGQFGSPLAADIAGGLSSKLQFPLSNIASDFTSGRNMKKFRVKAVMDDLNKLATNRLIQGKFNTGGYVPDIHHYQEGGIMPKIAIERNIAVPVTTGIGGNTININLTWQGGISPAREEADKLIDEVLGPALEDAIKSNRLVI